MFSTVLKIDKQKKKKTERKKKGDKKTWNLSEITESEIDY